MKRSLLLSLLPMLAVVATMGAALAAAPSAYADHPRVIVPQVHRPAYHVRDAERLRGERDGYSRGFDAGHRDGYTGHSLGCHRVFATYDLRRHSLAYQRGFRSGFDAGYSDGYRAGLAARARHGITFGHGHGHGGVTFGHGGSNGRGSSFGVRIRF